MLTLPGECRCLSARVFRWAPPGALCCRQQLSASFSVRCIRFVMDCFCFAFNKLNATWRCSSGSGSVCVNSIDVYYKWVYLYWGLLLGWSYLLWAEPGVAGPDLAGQYNANYEIWLNVSSALLSKIIKSSAGAHLHICCSLPFMPLPSQTERHGLCSNACVCQLFSQFLNPRVFTVVVVLLVFCFVLDTYALQFEGRLDSMLPFKLLQQPRIGRRRWIHNPATAAAWTTATETSPLPTSRRLLLARLHLSETLIQRYSSLHHFEIIDRCVFDFQKISTLYEYYLVFRLP